MIEKIYKTKNCEINYFHSDIGAKKSILFIHGWTAGWEVWTNEIEKYIKYYNIYAVDLPGHNKSGNLEKYDLEKYFEPIYEFTKSIKQDLTLIGHSLGASLSFMLASKLDNISKLVLEDPPWYSESRGEIVNNKDKDELINNQINKYETQRNFFLTQKKLWRTGIDAMKALKEFDPEAYKLFPERVAIRAIWAFHNDVNIWNVEDDWIWEDAIELSKYIKSKTLLIGGNLKKGALMTDVIANKVKSNMIECDLRYIDAGHFIRLEKPVEFNQLLDKFI